MPSSFFHIGFFVAAMIAVGVIWIRPYGLTRAILALGCRLLWTAPLLTLLYPRLVSEITEKNALRSPLHVLIDDSQSTAQSSRLIAAEAELDRQCQIYSCQIVRSRLSEMTKLGDTTPMNQALQQWSYRSAGFPWVVLSDGGDEFPAQAWTPVPSLSQTPGLIIGVQDSQRSNVWIEKLDGPALAFERQAIKVRVLMARQGAMNTDLRVQLQAESGAKILATANLSFSKGDESLETELLLEALPRGTHLVQLKLIPVPGEEVLWDNQESLAVEVMPNTVGMLHLLGGPSSDGRFMRRFLKAEPKFDLISFFILRDPWDVQSQVNERELSLIPFPVKRLFEDELNNFKAVIMQDFTLHQFLEPAHQDRLVQYVLDGGSMLFIGGQRALQFGDMQSGAFTKLLPFDIHRLSEKSFYPDIKFKIVMAQPTEEQRQLASIHEDWSALAPSLAKMEGLQGLHVFPEMRLKAETSAPLLEATDDTGKKYPLAFASYPGKGRALWILSDSMWRMALNETESVSRQFYDQFFSSAMAWLMRDEVKKPLFVEGLDIRNNDGRLEWKALLRGPSVPYFDRKKGWDIQFCQQPAQVQASSIRSDVVSLSGTYTGSWKDECTLRVSAEHPAFGKVDASSSRMIPKQLTDAQAPFSLARLRRLSKIMNAVLIRPEDSFDALGTFMKTHFAENSAEPLRQVRSWTEYFWAFHHPVIYWLFLFAPLEVLIRRWRELVG